MNTRENRYWWWNYIEKLDNLPKMLDTSLNLIDNVSLSM